MSVVGKSWFSLSHLFGNLWLFILAAGVFVIGLVLYAWRPIWLSPPYFAYTPILYLLIAQVWIAAWVYGIWRLPRRRLLVLLISIFCLPLTCIISLILAPQSNSELLVMRNEDYGSLKYGGLQEQHCQFEGRIFTCELGSGSSDNDKAFYYSYRFELIDYLPLMRLVSFNARIDCNPGYITCSSHDAP